MNEAETYVCVYTMIILRDSVIRRLEMREKWTIERISITYQTGGGFVCRTIKSAFYGENS